MAKFLKLTMSDALRGRQRTVHVNLDQVRVALPEAGGRPPSCLTRTTASLHVQLEQRSYAPLLYQFSGHLRKPYQVSLKKAHPFYCGFWVAFFFLIAAVVLVTPHGRYSR